MFDHQFFAVSSRRSASVTVSVVSLGAWYSTWNTVDAAVGCINGPNYPFPYLHPSPSDFAVCLIKEADSISLTFGFDFGYVTCFGRWKDSRSKA